MPIKQRLSTFFIKNQMPKLSIANNKIDFNPSFPKEENILTI